MAGLDVVLALGVCIRAVLLELADIGARDKGLAACAFQYDAADRCIGGEDIQRLGHAVAGHDLRGALAGDYLEAPEGSVALALVEVALAAPGRIDPPAELDEVDIRLLATQLDDATYELILRAAERAVQPDGSELYEVWLDAGGDELAEWRTAALSSVDTLRSAIAE